MSLFVRCLDRDRDRDMQRTGGRSIMCMCVCADEDVMLLRLHCMEVRRKGLAEDGKVLRSYRVGR